MNILFVASEAVPFAKTGGLADVIGSLPKALKELGMDIRVIIPKYGEIPKVYRDAMKTVATCEVQLGWRKQFCGIQQLDHLGVTYYFVDNEFYFKRNGLYGHDQDAERFAFFCRGVLESLPLLDFRPDVIHCHDWQSAMIPLLLKAHYAQLDFFQSIQTVMTIHNLKYQGIFPSAWIQELLGLSHHYFTGQVLEIHGGASFLKGGLHFADRITTVSPSYAEEIKTAYYGEHMDSLLRYRSRELSGIVNGIDYDLYNPMNDPYVVSPYRDSLSKKAKNKLDMQERFGLPIGEDKPMIAFVGRLVQQKGLDLIQHVLADLLAMQDVQWIILGTGEPRYEYMFSHAAWMQPHKIAAMISFDDALAHQIYAASDLFLMPSQFEPCGIGQLIAMRYRSIPIVRETGGLRDTVQPYNQFTGEGTGFTFSHYNAHDMFDAVQRAVHTYQHDPTSWHHIQNNMKKCDFSWKKSAQQYVELYLSLSSYDYE